VGERQTTTNYGSSPTVMLIFIIGIAVLITMLVTSNQTAHDEALRAKESDLIQQQKSNH
jgi:cbb3-type cytochrome oxidase subunit 3